MGWRRNCTLLIVWNKFVIGKIIFMLFTNRKEYNFHIFYNEQKWTRTPDRYRATYLQLQWLFRYITQWLFILFRYITFSTNDFLNHFLETTTVSLRSANQFIRQKDNKNVIQSATLKNELWKRIAMYVSII